MIKHYVVKHVRHLKLMFMHMNTLVNLNLLTLSGIMCHTSKNIYLSILYDHRLITSIYAH